MSKEKKVKKQLQDIPEEGHKNFQHIEGPIKPIHQHFVIPHPPKNTEQQQIHPKKWNQFFDEMFYLEDGTSVFVAGKQGPMYICIHGAGHSSQSFATLAKQIKKFGICISFDLRGTSQPSGHGYSKKQNQPYDLSINTLVSQCQYVITELMKKYTEPNIIIVGHSLGGSLSARATFNLHQGTTRILGIIIIDVVQGTAIQALPFMLHILQSRPSSFPSQEKAIEWSLSSLTLKNLESAQVSIPPQLKQIKNKEGKLEKLVWKVDLLKSQKFWKNWFLGMTNFFLGIKLPRLLISAERQRLDKELTIAMMQGKFRLTIIENVGHSVQEDDFKATAKALHDFISIFRIPMDNKESALLKEIGVAKFKPKIPDYS